jgi:hypothetical protein
MTVFDKQHPLHPGVICLVVFTAVMQQARKIRVLEEQVVRLSHNQPQRTI